MSTPEETASGTIQHFLDVDPVQLSGPGSTSGLWVASCACGTFTCEPQGTQVAARKEVYRHVRGVFRRIETSRQIEHDAENNPGNTLRSGLQAIVDMPGTVTKARLIALLATYPE